MGKACSVCNSVNRLEIDRLLVQDRSLASVSRQYGVSKDALSNHRKNHLSRQLVQAKESRDLFISQNMYDLITKLLNTSLEIMEKTKKDPKRYGIALKAQAESRRTIEFLHEVQVSMIQIRADDEHLEREKRAEHSQRDLSRLTVEELETLRYLTLKMEGKQQGRRTDLEKKAKRKEIRERHLAKKRKEKGSLLRRETPLKRVRVKFEEVIDEFDQMRNRLNMSNHPEMVKPAQADPWASL